MVGRLQIVVPMAGDFSFFESSDHFFPKPLIDMVGKPMVEHVISPLKRAYSSAQFIFLVRKEDIDRFHLDSILKICAGPDTIVIPLAASTQGALCSALMAIDHLDFEAPLLISNGDQVIDIDFKLLFSEVSGRHADATVVTFPSVHPRWSYVRVDESGFVTRAAEKNVISRDAVAGLYFYKTARLFVEASKSTILSDDRVDGNFYISSTINQMILNNLSVSAISIPESAYHSFYSPRKVDEYIDLIRKGLPNATSANAIPKISVVIPAAGQGSRFANAGWRKPKPFIDVGGKPMIQRVMDNVSLDNSRVIVLLRRDHVLQHDDIVGRLNGSCSIVPVESLTEGTLCTVMLARNLIGDDDAVLIANSDQIIDFSVSHFIKDCYDRDLDGSMVVFRDPEKNPKWSFAKINDDGFVVETVEKKAISDLATVGIYFFRSSRVLLNATIDMFAANDRVNGEFYTCPVYNYMIRMGARVGVYEVPSAAMNGLGIPEDLRIYLNRQAAPPSLDDPTVPL